MFSVSFPNFNAKKS